MCTFETSNAIEIEAVSELDQKIIIDHPGLFASSGFFVELNEQRRQRARWDQRRAKAIDTRRKQMIREQELRAQVEMADKQGYVHSQTYVTVYHLVRGGADSTSSHVHR